ncbi:VOC family protein [Kineococcus sp. T13]|uniref:VOC family protein n=1 Tax=Kineococcus vitellinus TaxID=2696565 RepID=UPI001412DD7A|nr:VOC family protein [Kineococcus vitellinus]
MNLVVDAADPRLLANWWAQALSWRLGYADDDEVDVDPPEGEPGLGLVFVPVDDVKTGPNRIHLDLDTSSPAEQRRTVEHLLDLGARPADVGQGEVPWTVLADPEGNELCVLDPRPEYDGCGSVAAIVCRALDPPALADFWAPLSGWRRVRASPDVQALRHGGSGPHLEFVRSPHPHAGKNRWHLDVRARRGGRGREHVVAEALRTGARHADVGQGDRVPWTVLADPEGNEFCVLGGEV